MSEKISPSMPPKSCVSWIDPFLIAIVIIAAYVAFRRTSLSDVELSLVLVGAVLIVMMPREYLRAPWRSTPRPLIPFQETLKKSAIKWLGVMLGLVLAMVWWFVVPEYGHPMYSSFFEAMPYVLPFVPCALAGCILFTEWRLGPSEDHAWHFGLIALGHYKEADWKIIRTGFFTWLVRGFFLPLNAITIVHQLPYFRGHEDDILTSSWPQIVSLLDHMILALLIVAIIPGYLFGSRLLGTEIKKVEQSWFGWVVTFVCYPPVNSGTGSGWFAYHTKSNILPWVRWFGSSETASMVVGCALIVFCLVHYWGESICGLRSSHLTNRGIITNGPFRLCKHPVYVAKCLAWALTFLPFMEGGSFLKDISLTAGFLSFCCVYGMRGWVEERLLSTDQNYVAYALWMEEHSLFRFMGRKMPLFSYTWRYQRWVKAGLLNVQ